MGRNVIVIGAGGNLGRRLIARGAAHGHAVTAFVRDAAGFAQRAGDATPARVIEGDARDPVALAAAIDGHDAVVNAAGNVFDGAAFVDLFAAIVAVAEPTLGKSRRFWALGGAGVLTIPYRDQIGIGHPGVPSAYLGHATNWRRLEASTLDWAMMCPGPMIAAQSGASRDDLRVTTDIVPYDVPRWTGWAPSLAISLLMKSKLPELTVTYDDVADIIMANLSTGGRFARHRVGVALPAGERARKNDWALGQRGGDS